MMPQTEPARRPKHLRFVTSALLGVCCAALAAGSASATVIISRTVVDFTGASLSFGYTPARDFTFSDVSGGIFSNPDVVGVSTVGDAAVTAFGLPFYDPPQPTTFFDPIRGSGELQFGPDGFNQFIAFPTATAIPYSATGFFIGLRDTAADGVHYGYGEFSGTTLLSYGFESVAGQTITISNVSLVPLPASAPMFGAAVLAIGVAGYGAKRRKAVAAS